MVALKSQGFVFEVQTAAGPPAVFTEIMGITNFNLFDGQAAEIDTTTLRSAAKEFIMGLQDFGSGSLDVNYLPDDAGQSELRDAKTDSEVRTFRATFSDGTTATFEAYVMSAPVSGGVDSKVEGSFSLRITGDVAFA